MEVWEIIAAAAAGLTAGQIGAWLQARRDRRAELERQAAETERLRLQLAEAKEQHDRDRSQTDTIEWRERRLGAYQAASSAVQTMLGDAGKITDLGVASAVAGRADGCHAAVRSLQQALDLCVVIGTKETRHSALSLAIAAEELDSAVSAYDHHVQDIEADPRAGPGELWRVVDEAIRLQRGRSVGAVDENVQRTVERAHAVGVALDEAYIRTEAWYSAARAELGVPD